MSYPRFQEPLDGLGSYHRRSSKIGLFVFQGNVLLNFLTLHGT